MKEIAHFSVQYQQILNEHSELVSALPAFASDVNQLVHLYRMMLLVRRFDAKAVALQRTGRMYTYPTSYGQEAVSVGMGAALKPEDVFVPVYRETGAQLQRGVRMSEILTYWGGDERGSHFQNEPAKKDYAWCVPLATQCLHAAGVAVAKKIKKEPGVVVVVIGDGATSEGSFYEAVNLSGAWNLPIIFVVNNNQWAISVPRTIQSGAQTMAQKGFAGGLEVMQVDGNDVIAMRHVMQEAREFVLKNKKPFLVEAITYRLGDHTTADDAKRYRDEQELEDAKKREPIARFKKYLEKNHAWNETKESQLIAECSAEVEKEADIYLNLPKQKPTDMFDYLYAELPAAYAEQRAEVETFGGDA